MNKKTISILCVTVLYSFLFYQQHVGINFLIFTIVAIAFFFFQDKEAFKSKAVILLSIGAIFSASFATIHGSNLSMWTTIVTLLVIPGVIINRRSALIIDFFSAIYTIIVSSAYMIIDVVESRKNGKGKSSLQLLKYLVPIVFIIIFFFIYRVMNPLFEKFTREIAEFISLGWVFFTLLGFLLVYSYYKQKRNKQLDNWEKNWLLTIDSEKVKTPKWNESLAFILFFLMLNIMLVVVNFMDINYLYLGKGMPDGITHKQFVHKGVGMLILSIILGISILLFFFRGQLNFTKNKYLIKAFAFLWVIQNAFMVCSTVIRNNMYVDASLLTYKRIGVYFWLFFAIIGLITLLIKLQRNKSVWFLARHNFTVLFVVLIFSSVLDWDDMISSFNLNRAHQMDEISSLDKNYLLSLSEGNIAQLYAIKELEGFEIDSVYSYQPDYYYNNSNWLDCKIYDFLLDDAEGDWRSYSVRRNQVRSDIKQLHDSGKLNSLNIQGHGVKSLSPIFSLNKLKQLNLNNNSNIKEKLAGINKLPQLQKLYLNDNYISNLDTLSANKNLTHLTLKKNLINNLKFLKNYPNLDTLELSNNKLITLSSLPELKKLKTLRLDGNPLNKISKLGELPNLKDLSLNYLYQSIGQFPKLAMLESLSVNNSPEVLSYGISEDLSFPSLIYLDISYNNLININVLINEKAHKCKTPQLESLIVNGNQLSHLYGIENFKQLKYLYASNNELYNLAGIEKLTELEELYLRGNDIDNLYFLKGMDQLKELNLGNNPNIREFNKLSNLNKLTLLNLSNTTIKSLEYINAETTLKILNLSGCRITNWELLKSYKALENISVSFLKKEDVENFTVLASLRYIHITSTEEEVINLLKKKLTKVEFFY